MNHPFADDSPMAVWRQVPVRSRRRRTAAWLMPAVLLAGAALTAPLTAPADDAPATAGSPQTPPSAAILTAPDSQPASCPRSPLEIEAQIAQAGTTHPDWWDSVPLEYPATLDLPGTARAQGWRPDVNVSTYLWDRVNKDPRIWTRAVKMLHHVVDVRRGDPPRLREAQLMLGMAYARLLADWPRAAYWLKQGTGGQARVDIEHVVALARCYWELGSRSAALAVFQRHGLDRRPEGPSIGLLARMGLTQQALQAAEGLSARQPDTGHLVAGNIHRRLGNLPKALACYDAVITMTQGSRRLKQHQQRARENAQALRLALSPDLRPNSRPDLPGRANPSGRPDLSRLPDGTYTGQALGYRGPVHVELTLTGGRMTAAKVTRHQEDVFYRSLTEVPEQIVAAQDPHRVDAVTGATVTSEAIQNAAVKALSRK